MWQTRFHVRCVGRLRGELWQFCCRFHHSGTFGEAPAREMCNLRRQSTRNNRCRDTRGTIPELMRGKSSFIFAGARSGHCGVVCGNSGPSMEVALRKMGPCFAETTPKSSMPGHTGHHPGVGTGHIGLDFPVFERHVTSRHITSRHFTSRHQGSCRVTS